MELVSSLGSINLIVGTDIFEDCLTGRSTSVFEGSDCSSNHHGVLWMVSRCLNLLYFFGATAAMLMLICLSNSIEWSTVPMPVIISACRGPNWEHSHTVGSVFRCRFGKFVFSQNFESKF